MAFKVFTPQRKHTRISSGQAAIAKSGIARFLPTDLQEQGIKGAVVILVDHDTHRLALRAPHADDDFTEPTLTVRYGKTGVTARVVLTAPLASLGLDPANLVGTHDLMIKDQLLILTFLKKPPRGKERRS